MALALKWCTGNMSMRLDIIPAEELFSVLLGPRGYLMSDDFGNREVEQYQAIPGTASPAWHPKATGSESHLISDNTAHKIIYLEA